MVVATFIGMYAAIVRSTPPPSSMILAHLRVEPRARGLAGGPSCEHLGCEFANLVHGFVLQTRTRAGLKYLHLPVRYRLTY